MKQKYREGTWFGVPLRRGGFGVGIVARAAVGKPIILCYFFGPRRESLPKIDEVSILKASSAILVLRASDLGLMRGDWPIIGTERLWNPANWPMPVFVRREMVSPFRNWLVYYSDNDPSEIIKEELEPNERSELYEDGLSGSGAAEIKLTKLLAEGRSSIEKISFSREVLGQLRNLGSDINKPHNFDFYLYLPSETLAWDAAKSVREKGFAAKVMPSTQGDKWLCRASKTFVPEPEPLHDIDHFFTSLAASLHGVFDGWESNVVKN